VKISKKPAGDDPDKRGRKEQIPFNFPLQIGDPKLREISKKVENFNDLGKIVEEMKSVSRKYDALGLAAPQIGVHQRIILLNLQKGKEKIFVNPVIIAKSSKIVPSLEGCLSVPALVASVPRHESVRLKAYDYSNEHEITEDFKGDDSFCLQHEIDHLDGILFLDRVEEKEAIGVSNFRQIRAGEVKIIDELVQDAQNLPKTIALSSIVSFFLALSVFAASK